MKSGPFGRPARWLPALLGMLLLLAACTQAGALAPVDLRWPSPAPLPAPTVQPSPVSWTMRTTPDFEAPSATQCARPVQTVETPGPDNAMQRAKEARSMHRETLRDEAMPAPAPLSPPVDAMMRKSMPPPAEASIQPQRSRQEIVTAGMVDDNADFSAFLQFRQRTVVQHLERDVSERYLLKVRNAAGAPVADAEVAVRASSGAAMWARTDASGSVWLHPNAFDPNASQIYEVAVRKNGHQAGGYLRRGQKSAVDINLDAGAPPARAKLDLVFLVDATGSMGDEIGKLRATLHSIASEVARLPSRPDTCFGLVAYRDRGDIFMLRRHDFTNDLAGFQSVLDALQADGGGDYPEAMSEALHETVHNLSWRGTDATRMVVLLADAPPHLDYGGPRYDDDMLAALGKGIKIFSVGASGLDKQGEYIQRQIAQYTGGRFVFLTYRNASDPGSGPGRETPHDVSNYSVQTLDRLIVRLVGEELAKLPRAG